MSTNVSSLEKAWHDAARDGSTGEFAPVGIFGTEVSPAQMDMLADENGKMPANVFSIARSKGPGRPKGSVNKASRDLEKFLLHKYGCPVEFMASVRAMPLDQITHALMDAEGYSKREAKLFELIDKVEELQLKALTENWSEAKLKLLDRMLDRVEKAASSMKAKPGDLATKALSLQLAAARDESRYVRSPMPVQATVTHKSDGTLIMAGAVPSSEWQGDSGPVGQVMRRIADGVNTGEIDASQLKDIRIVDAEYHVVGEDDDDIDEDDD